MTRDFTSEVEVGRGSLKGQPPSIQKMLFSTQFAHHSDFREISRMRPANSQIPTSRAILHPHSQRALILECSAL